jgi:hypothetical protein
MGDKSSIQIFWETIKENDFTTKELQQFFIESYTEDFVENSKKWKDNLLNMNYGVKNVVKTHTNFNIKKWKDITFDQFCKGVIQIGSDYIKDNHTISSDIVEEIPEAILQQHLKDLDVDSFQEDDKTEISVNALFESFQTPIIFI